MAEPSSSTSPQICFWATPLLSANNNLPDPPQIICSRPAPPLPEATEGPEEHRRWFREQILDPLESLAWHAKSARWSTIRLEFAYAKADGSNKPTRQSHALHLDYPSLGGEFPAREATAWAQSVAEALFPPDKTRILLGWTPDPLDGALLVFRDETVPPAEPPR